MASDTDEICYKCGVHYHIDVTFSGYSQTCKCGSTHSIENHEPEPINWKPTLGDLLKNAQKSSS